MSGTNEYVLGTHDPEADRLRVQHELWLDDAWRAWDAIGVGPGARVIDLGCGPGLVTQELAARVGATGLAMGVELSPVFVRQARERCARFGSTAAIEELDLMTRDLPEALHGTFDAAWIRWLLMFLPDTMGVLAFAHRALRPGGRLAIHEYVDYTTYGLEPHGPRIAEFVQYAMASFASRQGDANIGARLPGLLESSGFHLESRRRIARRARPGDALWHWPAGFVRTYAPRLVEMGFADHAWLAATLAELDAAERNPDAQIVCPTLLEAIAIRP